MVTRTDNRKNRSSGAPGNNCPSNATETTQVVSEIAGAFSGRAEIIARKGHIKYNIALCFQPINTFDFTQTCDNYNISTLNRNSIYKFMVLIGIKILS